jgi:2-polyprenyl-3-methyl-5-hydroxy-6-metoxy-1,4-benzoquinol methylase
MVRAMEQTPLYSFVNQDILKLMDSNYKRVVEVGCMDGALAKAYREKNTSCQYTGVEINDDYAKAALLHCSEAIAGNIEEFDDDIFDQLFPSDCWVFGDVLEHLYDPWKVLSRIREKVTSGAHIIVCVPNVQHWSVQAMLNAGQFRYKDTGLMDRTHIRWFTRITLIEMFQSCGFNIIAGVPIVAHQPPDGFLPVIRQMAIANGIDPAIAVNDSLAYQWVVKAVPA